MHKIIAPPNLAQEIYNYLKSQIPTLPNFWSEVSEENKEFLVFNSFSDSSMDKYFNDYFQRISFNVNLMLKKDNKEKQLNVLKNIILNITKFKKGSNWEAVLLKINDSYITSENDLNFITIDELLVNIDSQNSTFAISYLLKRKE